MPVLTQEEFESVHPGELSKNGVDAAGFAAKEAEVCAEIEAYTSTRYRQLTPFTAAAAPAVIKTAAVKMLRARIWKQPTESDTADAAAAMQLLKDISAGRADLPLPDQSGEPKDQTLIAGAGDPPGRAAAQDFLDGSLVR